MIPQIFKDLIATSFAEKGVDKKYFPQYEAIAISRYEQRIGNDRRIKRYKKEYGNDKPYQYYRVLPCFFKYQFHMLLLLPLHYALT